MPSIAQADPPRFDVVGPTTKKATRPTKELPESLIRTARNVEKEEFDAARHVNYVPPKKVWTMADIGLEGVGISPTAISEPFPLFTESAVKQFRADLFSEPVLERCQFASSFATNMIRGYDATIAPFIHKAWASPEVLGAVSSIAGVDLVPAMDYEIGHCNISINDEKPTPAQLKSLQDGSENEAFAWHRDSFPFVCVTMVSDCRNMVGGETVLRTGDGNTMKARGPTMGTAVVMQGRYIEHMALKSFGGGERISLITPFRPRSPFAKDEVVLTTVRGISFPELLYPQFAEYRLEILKTRIEWLIEEVKQQRGQKKKFVLRSIKDYLYEQQHYIDATLDEMIDDGV
ncbi:hypothetical protein BDV25DRAFT_170013 [Aspergillus avenaceus]|uniref:Fe2OG dioxygenase domain-containing protein n=1 Tax=Aspergillus avenaceus TaxID=36643 RepID=A0A5N6U3D8_ASPAV|nr:hypothetical protein BDV25DRAFT_170013 [Aspergillus avenaceus]